MTTFTTGIFLAGSFLAGILISVFLKRFCAIADADAPTHPLFDDLDTGVMVVCAARYCFNDLGKSSYVSDVAFRWLKRHWFTINPLDRELIIQDLSAQVALADADLDAQHLGPPLTEQQCRLFFAWVQSCSAPLDADR